MSIGIVGYAAVVDRHTVRVGADGLLPVFCPAAQPVAAVRQATSKIGHEVPGVVCRIVHEPMDLESDPMGVGTLCCHPEGHRTCPILRYDHDLMAAGFKSFGDVRELEAGEERAYREVLTGSAYGDTSFMEAVDKMADDAVADLLDPELDGFIRAEDDQ